MRQPTAALSGAHVFVDESERGQKYYLCAIFIGSSELSKARKELRGLLKPGMRRLHMVKERDPLRDKILSTLADFSIVARIYVGSGKSTRARAHCLERCVQDSVSFRAERLVLDDHSGARHDRRLIAEALRKEDSMLRYDHMRSFEEPMLWAADCVAWAYGAGARWRDRVTPIVERAASVGPR